MTGRSARQAVIGGFVQSVATTPNRLDVVLPAGEPGEFLSKLADEYVDDLDLRLVHAAVKMVEKHLLGQRRALAQGHELQHGELLHGEVDRLACDLGLFGV